LDFIALTDRTHGGASLGNGELGILFLFSIFFLSFFFIFNFFFFFKFSELMLHRRVMDNDKRGPVILDDWVNQIKIKIKTNK